MGKLVALSTVSSHPSWIRQREGERSGHNHWNGLKENGGKGKTEYRQETGYSEGRNGVGGGMFGWEVMHHNSSPSKYQRHPHTLTL